MDNYTAIQAKRIGVYCCSADTLLIDAARQMLREDISCLVVLDNDGYLVGIITRTDMLRALSSAEWGTQFVGEFMNKQVVTVSPDDTLLHISQLLINRQIHRVVIVQLEDGRKKPIGVISDADILYHMVRSA